jgi:F-type H+-transporting ATPase subunit b
MIDILPGNLLLQGVNFLVLLFVLNFILYRPIRRAIEERRKTFEGMQNEVRSLNGDAQKSIEEWEAGLDVARKAGLQKREGIKKESLDKEKNLIQGVRADAEAKMNQVRGQIVKDMEEVRGQLKAQIESFSRDMAEKVLGRSIS